jgi:hypothetical protein
MRVIMEAGEAGCWLTGVSTSGLIHSMEIDRNADLGEGCGSMAMPLIRSANGPLQHRLEHLPPFLGWTTIQPAPIRFFFFSGGLRLKCPRSFSLREE